MVNPKEGDPPRIIYFKSWNNGWSNGLTFANNIIVNQCKQAIYVEGESKGNQYRNNLFFGEHPESEPADPKKSLQIPCSSIRAAAGDGDSHGDCRLFLAASFTRNFRRAASSPATWSGISPADECCGWMAAWTLAR